MKKINEFTRKYLIGFTLGLISASALMVYAATYFPSNQVTYENGSSGMQATDVQGAIDELYLTCTAKKVDVGGKEISIVTSGDGLYTDEYEDGKYKYKGANPNNYVTFNNETAGWRIISINSDGTIKIMKDASIGYISWDTSGGTYGSNNWNRPADLNTLLNSTGYNGLTGTAQSQIVEATYNAGAVTRGNNDMEDQISDEKVTTSKAKIALPTVSEYIRANSNKEQCGTLSLNNDNENTCKNSNWMVNSDTWWTLSPSSDTSYDVFRVGDYGYVSTIFAYYKYHAVRPTITLSSEVQITGGNGSKENPYTLSSNI